MNPFLRLSSVVMLVGSTLLTGCFGYDRILFVTKTNVGLDVENKPPTAEITIARREIAIAPTFRDTIDGHHKTLPLLAAFGRTGGLFTTGLKSHFAGGDAAISLAQGLPPEAAEDEDKVAETGGAEVAGAGGAGAETAGTEAAGTEAAEAYDSSIICLDKEPDSRPPLKKFWHWLTGGRPDENTRAFYFATDTVFGIKVGWDGTGGPYPTNLKLGYNRKELAFPPVFINPKVDGKCSLKDKNGQPVKHWIEENGERKEVIKPGYQVTVPSFFASLDNESSLAERTKEQQLEPAVAKAAAAKATAVEAAAVEAAQPDGAAAKAAADEAAAAQTKAVEAAENLAALRRDLNLKHVQFFATGKAATEWVKRREVNENAYKEMRGVE